MAYYSTKTYGHNIGLSAVFRQPHADHSHCRFLHGYSLQFKFTFGSSDLDHRNWVQDFGGLKPLNRKSLWKMNVITRTTWMKIQFPFV